MSDDAQRDARLRELSWPVTELGAALLALRRQLGAPAPALAQLEPHPDAELSAWLPGAAAELELELEAVDSRADALEFNLRRLGPALIELPPPAAGEDARVLVVLAGGLRYCTVLTPAGRRRYLLASTIAQRLQASLGGAVDDVLARVLARVGTLDDAALRLARHGDARIGGLWVVRPAVHAPLTTHARSLRLPARVAATLVVNLLSTMSLLGLYWLIGRTVFGAGGASPLALLLCGVTMVVMLAAGSWIQTELARDIGSQLKQAQLRGILSLDPDALSGRGAGQFLAMAMAGELASNVTSSMQAVVSQLIGLGTAVAILAWVDAKLGLALLAWSAVVAWLCSRYAEQARLHADDRRAVTEDLIERMVGYQTRLVQEHPELRHPDEDQLLHRYLLGARELYQRQLPLTGVIGTVWLLVALALLEPTLRAGCEPEVAAVILGGMLTAASNLRGVAASAVGLSELREAWLECAPLLEAARVKPSARPGTQSTDARPVDAPPGSADADPHGALLRFDELSLRYGSEGRLVLRRCGQVIGRGERVLLEGPSGGGKSTLAIVLAGLRAPDSGRLEFHGAGPLREQVTLVPQFHTNHVLTASLMFNVLLGSAYPPGPEDVHRAQRVCALLGLGPLLERMPLGLGQPVGDGGWALSHGERSRVFLARALLQTRAELLILDESFAALDPETLLDIGRGLLGSEPALLVIAHV